MDYLALFDKELARARACTHAQLALHSCCAVCSSAVLELLSPHFEITVVYCNPNIFPLEEYDKRKSEQLRIIRETNWPNPIGVADLDYDHGEFLAVASGLESEPEGGKRCERCFELRMRATARYASEHSISLFCSTLTVSPHKNAISVNAAGARAADEFGVNWLYSDFKKRDGYLRSIRLAQQHDIYRQRYCGCEFSAR